MKIEKPIFIVGSGRSGTTILYKLLSQHPEVCWFSNITDRFPMLPQVAALHRLLDLPYLGNWLKHRNIAARNKLRFRIRPAEAERIYHSFCRLEKAGKTTEEDYSEETAQRLKRIIKAHMRMTEKSRFLIKQTANNQRIRLMNRMFPDAFFVHIIRDGRAVANSLFMVKWWNDVDIWWLGCKPPKWDDPGKEPIELCALQWKRDVNEILNNRHLYESRYIEVRYEDLVQDVHKIINVITDFCNLRRSNEFRLLLPKTLPDMNWKWKKNLTVRQKKAVEGAIGEFQMQLGYEP